jgi:hypothetical protein
VVICGRERGLNLRFPALCSSFLHTAGLLVYVAAYFIILGAKLVRNRGRLDGERGSPFAASLL